MIAADEWTDADEIAELEATIEALEADIATLKTENKKFDEMRVQWEQGGFENVIAGKDEVIRALETRVSSESREKVSNLRALEWWKKQAIKLGWSRDAVIDLKTGEVSNA